MRGYKWIIGLLLMMLLSACSKDEKTETPKQPSMISVYVYLPERPIATRTGEGEVNPIQNLIDESIINNLQIWVFNHDTKALIAYHNPNETINLGIENEENVVTYQLKVSPEFEAVPDGHKPLVDVYVLANVTGYDSTTERDDLDAALLDGTHFGLESLTTEVPEGGLPMAAVNRGATVDGMAPVYKITHLKLTRTVSKLRFIFSRDRSEIPVKMTSVQLDANMIPTDEYLFLGTDNNPYHIGNSSGISYNDLAVELLAENDPVKTDICQNGNPLTYAYNEGMDPQEYENKIMEGLSGETPELSLVGPFYLRESDKQLSGTIKYMVGDTSKPDMRFTMSNGGQYEFSRNHTWTVYAYCGSSGLELIKVIVKDWDDSVPRDYGVFNW